MDFWKRFQWIYVDVLQLLRYLASVIVLLELNSLLRWEKTKAFKVKDLIICFT